MDQIASKVNKTKTQGKKVDVKAIEAFIKSYFETTDAPSLKTVLKRIKVDFRADRLVFKIGTEIDKSTLLNEGDFLQKVRELIDNKYIHIQFEIDESLKPKEVEDKHDKTDQEILQDYQSEHPWLKDMIDEFEFKINSK